MAASSKQVLYCQLSIISTTQILGLPSSKQESTRKRTNPVTKGWVNITYTEANSEGFRMAVHPAASAAATFHVAIKSG
jgi:hypothetical protein